MFFLHFCLLKKRKRSPHVPLKPCGTVFTVSTQKKPVIVPGMLFSPFIVLGFNACFAFGIKIHSFLCQEIKNPFVFLPKLFQDHHGFLRLTSPDSILPDPRSGLQRGRCALFVRAFPPQHCHTEQNCPLSTRNDVLFTSILHNCCGLPNQTYCNSPP